MDGIIYIGVDPGKKGAIAFYYSIDNNTDSIVTTTFNESRYIKLLKEIPAERAMCCLERVHALPKQGVSSTFSFGENYGFIRGILETLGIPYQTVTPNVWKKFYGVTADKNTSIEVCRRLFPNANLMRTERCKKPDNNIAEAILIANYARKTM